MVKNIIFDIGNVLVSFRWRELMRDLGISEEVQEVFKKTVFESPWWGELDHGIKEESEVISLLREDNKSYYDEFDLVWENRGRLVEPYSYAKQWIDELKAKGYRVYLLSNYPRDLFKMHEESGCFPFADSVDGRVVSGFVKMVKPNEDIYEYLVDKFALRADECVFIDDREDNVETARRLGMRGIVFESYEQACGELEKLL